MEHPVFCTLDNHTYEESAILDWLTKARTSPLNRNPIPQGLEPKDVLFSHKLAQQVIADLQQAPTHQLALI